MVVWTHHPGCLPVVHVSLGAVFDEGNPELDIGAVGQEVQPDDDAWEGEDQDDHHEQEDGRQQAQAQSGHGLTRALEITILCLVFVVVTSFDHI